MLFCGHNVPSCTALHVMLKGISVDKFHNLKFSFCIFIFEKNKIKLVGHGALIIWHVTMHSCTNFEVILY